MTPVDCGDRPLAYWAGDKPWSAIPLEWDDRVRYVGNTKVIIYLNGKRMTALLDTGSPITVMTARAAARAGVTPQDTGVTPTSPVVGIGQTPARAWIGKFQDFKMGGEEVKNTLLRFGDFDLPGTDIVLGEDFFISHHIYVSNIQKKIYFTYNGGPFFSN